MPKTIFWLGALFAATAFAADESARVHFHFSFGLGKVAADTIRVSSNTVYDPERGYGFEPGGELKAVENAVTSGKLFYFSVAVPEGNYRVTATLGDDQATAVTTIKAELRRLMVEKVTTAAGKFEKRTFIVNIRTRSEERRVGKEC